MAFQVSTEWDTSRIPISRVALNLIRSFFRCDAKNPFICRFVHRSTILSMVIFLEKFENSISTLDEERYLTRPLVSVLTWYIKKNSSYPRIHPICKYFRVKRWSTNDSILIRDQLPAIDSFQECWIYITNNVYQDRYSVSLNFHWYNTRFHSSARYYFPYEYTRFNGKDLTS